MTLTLSFYEQRYTKKSQLNEREDISLLGVAIHRGGYPENKTKLSNGVPGHPAGQSERMEQKVGREGEGTREEGRSDEGGGGEEPGEVSESRGRHQANDVCIGEVCTCMYRRRVYMYV